MKNKILFRLALVWAMVPLLSACHVPVLDKEITLPFLEKNPSEAFNLMMQAMDKTPSLSFKSDWEFSAHAELARLGITKDKLAAFQQDQVRVMGIMGEAVASSSQADERPNIALPDEKQTAITGELPAEDILPATTSEAEKTNSTDSIEEKNETVKKQISVQENPAASSADMKIISDPDLIGQEPVMPNFPFNSGPVDIKLTIAADGKLDQNDRDHPKSQTNYASTFSAGGVALQLDLQAIDLGDISYFKIGQIPYPFSEIIGPEWTGVWLEFDAAKIAAKQKEYMELAGKLPAGMDESSLDYAKNKEKVRAVRKEIITLAKTSRLITIGERLPDEEIDGKKCYHLKASLNKDKMGEFTEGVVNIVSQHMNDANPAVFKGLLDRKEFKSFISKISQAIKSAEGELWIDKKDFYLRKITYELGLDIVQLLPEEQKGFGALDLKVAGHGQYSDFGLAADVQTPSGTRSVIDLFDNTVLKKLENSRANARDARRISDIRQIQTAAELYYNDLGKYPETIVSGGEIKTDGITYLMAVPENPSPGGLPYAYVRLDDGQSYRLSYQLENDVGEIKGGIMMCATAKSINDDCADASAQSDSDGDGLLDAEEKNIFATDPMDPDMDKDGFLDGDEIKNGYNPKGPGKLVE